MKPRAQPLAPVLAITIALAGCSSVSSFDYRSETSPEADFTKYSTYSWSQPKGNSAEERGVTQATEQMVITAIDTTFEAKGYRWVSSNADMLVNFFASTQEKSQYGSYTASWSYDSSNRGATRETYAVGSLVIDVIDADSDSVVWTGSVSSVLDPTTTQEFRIGRLNEAISGLLARFPSKGD